MDLATLILSLTPIPLVSILVWILILLTVMYFSRKPIQQALLSGGRLFYSAMRLAAVAVASAEKRLRRRNHEVLLNAGLEIAEHRIEREFERLSTLTQRELEGYPQLQRRLREEIVVMEEDYKRCAEIPQGLPDWTRVIEGIAGIQSGREGMVADMLDQIRTTLVEQHKGAAERHRRAVSERHRILSRMIPVWRGLQRTLIGVESVLVRIDTRSRKIDRYIEAYEITRSGDEPALRQLSYSAMTRFLVSGLVLAVAAVGVVINFNLVAQPLAEMVGGTGRIGMFRTSDVVGVLTVGLQLSLGIFIMDALGATRMFSVFGGMQESRRRLLLAGLLLLLVALAGAEASLAFMRERFLTDLKALRESLSGAPALPANFSRIPAIGQMVMGFLLPLLLFIAAIPFEAFLASGRTVLGVVAAWLLRVAAFGLRLTGNLGLSAARLLITLFDIAIFPALWLEDKITQRKAQRRACSETSS